MQEHKTNLKDKHFLRGYNQATCHASALVANAKQKACCLMGLAYNNIVISSKRTFTHTQEAKLNWDPMINYTRPCYF
ncbi:hypothetical protein AMTR_s00147p00105040, partial [Amborella trichopoda]